MGINLGNSSISSFKLGSNSVSKVYLGNSLIWPSCVESSLLLHFNGNNGDTSTVDSSINNRSITFAGNANISTAQSKFGNSSLNLTNGGYVSFADSPSLLQSIGYFTIECWVYVSDTATTDYLQIFGATGSIIIGIVNSSGSGGLFIEHAGVGGLGYSAGSVPRNQWVHLAVSRSINDFKLFIDGSLVGSTYYEGSFIPSENYTIGLWGSDIRGCKAYIDDFRVINALAYIDNFIVPSNQLSSCTIATALSYGTYLFGGCVNGNLVNTYADGNGGTYTETISVGSCNGWNGFYYYIDGVQTNLPQSGSGTWNNLYYVSGSLYTGYVVPTYYVNGEASSLDQYGNGFWNNQAYYNGNAQSTGWNTYYYYIDNTQTDLNSNGDGCWNGYVYYSGVISEETC